MAFDSSTVSSKLVKECRYSLCTVHYKNDHFILITKSIMARVMGTKMLTVNNSITDRIEFSSHEKVYDCAKVKW